MRASKATAVTAVFVLASAFLTTGPNAQPTTSGEPHPGTPQKCYYNDASNCVTPSPHPQQHPNVVPIAIKLKTTYPCKVDGQLYVYTVTLKNAGPVAYVKPAGVVGAVPLVWIDDLHNGGWPHGWWGMEIGETPPIPAHATINVDVFIAYDAIDPKHMTAYPTHPFQPKSLAYYVPGKGLLAPGVAHNGGPIVNVPSPKGCP